MLCESTDETYVVWSMTFDEGQGRFWWSGWRAGPFDEGQGRFWWSGWRAGLAQGGWVKRRVGLTSDEPSEASFSIARSVSTW